MLSLQALALIILTLSDDVALSIVGPFAVYSTDAAVGGVTYPLDLMVGGFEPDSGRALWKARMASEWKAIAEEFGVTDVLTYPDWELRLPVVARSGSFTSRFRDEMVRPEGVEPPAYRFEACRSIQLSYGRTGAECIIAPLGCPDDKLSGVRSRARRSCDCSI